MIQEDGTMEFISIDGEGATQELENIIQSSFEQILSSNLLAAKKLKLGDSFPVKLPMSFPIAGFGVINFDIEMLYTLNNISENIANFDISFSMVVSSELKKANISAFATGKGTMQYDTINKVSPLMESTMEMNLQIPLEGVYLKAKSVSDSRITTSFNKN